jgi:excisionase family DNA binding protein
VSDEPRNPIPELDLLTKQEVADALRVTLRTVERLVKRGRLRMVRLSNVAVRFHRADVLAFVKANTVGMDSEEPD